jgi:hypothetical protein
MITREEVADLQKGDVVKVTFAAGSSVRGPLVETQLGGGIGLAEIGMTIRQRDGEVGYGFERSSATLTVISRAPRPEF